MTDLDPRASCDGRPLLIHRHVDRHLFYVFELDADEAERCVPEPLQIVEIRPGVALLSVALVRYPPDQIHPGSAGFWELVAAIHVAPRLDADMPLPAMTIATFSVLSDSADFVAQEAHTLFAPARLTPLAVELTPDQLGVAVSDPDGPILALPSAHPPPRWVGREMWGQHYTNTRGLQHGIWHWDGRLFDHQKRLPGWALHPHPFWRGLDLDRVRGLYRTMVLAPDSECQVRFWVMRPLTS